MTPSLNASPNILGTFTGGEPPKDKPDNGTAMAGILYSCRIRGSRRVGVLDLGLAARIHQILCPQHQGDVEGVLSPESHEGAQL